MKYLRYKQIAEKFSISYVTAVRIANEIEKEVNRSDSKLPSEAIAYVTGKNIREDVLEYYVSNRVQFKDETRRKKIPKFI